MVAKGFTAVEVLVTLFIAVLLIGGGYQAYGLVNSNSQEARERSTASNHAYEALRRLAVAPPSTCPASPSPQDITSELPSDSGLSGPYTMTATYSCPYGSGHTISQLTVRILYGPSSPQKEVEHAVYVRANS